MALHSILLNHVVDVKTMAWSRADCLGFGLSLESSGLDLNSKHCRS